MTVTYDTLVGPKGTAGSIMNWVGYGKIDAATVLDEAQLLLYSMLRVREMRSNYAFSCQQGQSSVALPPRFLDPIGDIIDTTVGTEYSQTDETSVKRNRAFDTSPSGTFGTDPFTTSSGSSTVTCAMTAHGLNQSSIINIPSGPTVNGLVLSGAFSVTSIIDANTFTIFVHNDTGATASGSGGGAGVTWTASNLIQSRPTQWAIWDEQIKFDCSFDGTSLMTLGYYSQPKLLSSTNQSNFLITRYQRVLRVACNAAAAEFMKDDGEYQKNITALSALIQSTAASDDLSRRGAVMGTDTP